MEHRQDFHRAFISHLDQDFKCVVCACLSVCLLPVSLFLDSLHENKSQVSTRHFTSLLSKCGVQRHCTLTLSIASRILQSVLGLADQSFEICYLQGVALCAWTSCCHFTAALLSSSIAQRTSSTLPQLYHAATIHQQPLGPPNPIFLLYRLPAFTCPRSRQLSSGEASRPGARIVANLAKEHRRVPIFGSGIAGHFSNQTKQTQIRLRRLSKKIMELCRRRSPACVRVVLRVRGAAWRWPARDHPSGPFWRRAR